MDDKQKTNEEVKASSFDSEKSSKNQAFENTEEPAEGFQNVQHDNGSNPAQKQNSEAKEASKDQTNMNNNELSKKLEQLETERLTLQEKIAVLEQQHRELEEFLLKMKHEFALAKEALKRDQEKKERLLAESMARDLFPILDTLDHALEHDGENNGLRLIRSQLVSVLEKYGVVEVGKEGEVFDPNWHEFLGYAEGPENKIIKVVRKGYKIGDTLLRPALVVIGKESSC
ncbi:MAG TPA: nucleotide exchange factor GrpE [Coprothermobacter proteolyticus]|uniref:nucleotide exchange factor GrpE n=1 Tax=Coprothermobacter proteolyticus TaxID=35786 RepID=UPI000D311965|nr:nucleotide exchange factor GrpE [Coprothermobacter proteolyticus]MBP8983442.1 nucleotide exchange factor GrpE [Coprothermobacter sp.]HOK24380.1 nucleotide exchange factor GrpE [Coprothermobacter proteolyticus]HOL53345.1 nucleotide exchange factor GrpE [Coprothermobacter proteolyticus]HPO83797.1 nucleotide exchange factor GrpE [Coprothermobacter proteolyticus]